jgi:hypothetical protein
MVVRRHVSSIDHTQKTGLQVVVCGIGSAVGLIIGVVVVFFTGLWSKFGEAILRSLRGLHVTVGEGSLLLDDHYGPSAPSTGGWRC